ncbi:hypothetical protein [Thiothrix nivea]|uniref:Uncharacterized protein n=1 Tax=Thiothrix nivea (strain ATCC 35100 / DSM 5205 / JP2) TaxID=870187 RepID=A0A656HKG4_THINJ|nr:hypothetical protein [Thiothrix nivea]EIJ35800.1 hypothetical protein Thini_3283 [Thiothrix nivea DSM 5205]
MLVIIRHLLSGMCLLLPSMVANAQTTEMPVKKTGISLNLETRQQDYDLTSLSFSHPALTPLANVKERIAASSDVQSATLKLDRWLTPNINLFGSVGKMTGEGTAKLPVLPGLNLPDVRIDADGSIYSLGGTAVARKDQYFSTITYTFTRYKADAFEETNTFQSLMPMAGVTTPVGAFSLALRYQQGDGNYVGKTTTPFGEVTANIGLKDKHATSWQAGYYARLGNDLSLRTSAELGGREGFRLELNRRF